MPWDNTKTVHPAWLAFEFGTCVGVWTVVTFLLAADGQRRRVRRLGRHRICALGDHVGDGEARVARRAAAARTLIRCTQPGRLARVRFGRRFQCRTIADTCHPES